MSSAINSEKRKKERREERKKGKETIPYDSVLPNFFSVYVPASNLRTHPAGTSQEFENDTKINMWLASFLSRKTSLSESIDLSFSKFRVLILVLVQNQK